ncbi:four-carbon acid sugar kinase family protein [Flavimaricola marinus]|uniref:Uncharacterized protein n=1 Tax=Flavimaricola marinus TaxID=1819565 RepID=A0A238LMB3_9RHOB|nr:four-carbon acid sugar kinase family protein [Flavimaricola marinus]SMY09980.1 hypothetical protein LOM8899_04154 [Flavimaricola marinus]
MSKQSNRLLLAWYGDDFTGAAAVMEVLEFSGIPSMLFLEAPTPEQVSRYEGLRAVGIASTARAQTPDWMDENLPSAFSALLALDPQLLHYKICSTLDSSPEIGSIGRAIEIATDLIETGPVPLLVAAPQMQRYQVFGHLFAGHGTEVYRLDRHPVMARHPVTPMAESDVGRHVEAQSDRLTASVWSQDMGTQPLAIDPIDPNRIQITTMDCMDASSEAAGGRMLWQNRETSRFVVGSQGVEFALVRHWIETGMLTPQEPPASAGRCDGMVTISGSVSPTTAEQIGWSRHNGFATIRFDPTCACGGEQEVGAEVNRVISASLDALSNGTDPLIFTAEGPDDPATARFNSAAQRSGKKLPDINRVLGDALGKTLEQILKRTSVRRAVISGGDTSGHATRQLDIFALSALAPTIPGASLFKAHADGPMDGLELALKGGQMGSTDYFDWIRNGGGLR